MKVFNFFSQVFSIFAFLTIGSLLMIVAGHILSFDDAVLKINEIYHSPWRSVQTGFVGIVFITVGLALTRALVKKGRDSEAVIYQSSIGPVLVSVTAMEDAVKKAMKRFHLVKHWRVKTLIHSKDVEIRLRLVLWYTGKVPELVTEIQADVAAKVGRLLGEENKLEVTCDVRRLEDHSPDYPTVESFPA